MLITPVLKVPTNKSSIRRNKKLLYEVKLKGVFEYYWVHLGNNLLYEKTHSRFGLLEKFSKSCDMFWFIAHLQWCIAFHYLFNKTGRKESISIS